MPHDYTNVFNTFNFHNKLTRLMFRYLKYPYTPKLEYRLIKHINNLFRYYEDIFYPNVNFEEITKGLLLDFQRAHILKNGGVSITLNVPHPPPIIN